MRRVWRFILALSVTPLMTVGCALACGAIVIWIACDRARLQGQFRVWDVPVLRQVVNKLVPPNPFQMGSSAYFTEKTAYILFDESLARFHHLPPMSVLDEAHREMERLRRTMRGPKVRIEIGEPMFDGRFALTRAVRGVETRVTYPDGTQWPIAEQTALIERFTDEAELKRYVKALGKEKVWSEEIRVLGYVQNVLFAVFGLLGVRSLVWLWRGVRWPWGSQTAWNRPLQHTEWRFRDGAWLLFFSPISTFILGVAVVAAIVPFADRSRGWDRWAGPVAQWVLDQQVAATALGSPQFIDLKNIAADEWEVRAFTTFELPIPNSFRHTQYVVLNSAESDYVGWPAPVRCTTHPLAQTNPNVPLTEGQRRAIETYIMQAKAVSPADLPLLWQPGESRLLWRGYLYNAMTYVLALVWLVSCRWMWTGVVWPWNVRRLRNRIACHRCGYSLLGLTTQTCPECGEPAAV